MENILHVQFPSMERIWCCSQVWKVSCVSQLTCAPISLRKGCRLPSYGKGSSVSPLSCMHAWRVWKFGAVQFYALAKERKSSLGKEIRVLPRPSRVALLWDGLLCAWIAWAWCWNVFPFVNSVLHGATPLENRACTGLVLLVVALHVSLSAALLSMCLVWVMFGCSKIFRIHPEILLMDGILVIKFRKFCYCVALPVWYLQEQKI